jgi:hypothetical protein
VTKHIPIETVNPFAERGVTDQLNAWASALEMAVSTLNRTLAEFKEFQEKGVADVRSDTAGEGDTPGGGNYGTDGREHGGVCGDG